MQTPGFRGDDVNFRAVLAEAGDTSVAFADAGTTTITRESGAINKTGNPFDFAVKGDGWLAYSTPVGTVYSRDGRVQIDGGGTLRSINGYPLLDAGNAPLSVDPAAGQILVSQDGMITQGGRQVGAIGLFQLSPAAKLTRFDNSSVIADKPASPILDFTNSGVLQGYLESSNVDAASQMVQLVMVSRAFEAVSNASQTTEGTMTDAIKTLG